jgi:hypothetical protein
MSLVKNRRQQSCIQREYNPQQLQKQVKHPGFTGAV